jgi:hypothetical protein
MNILAICQQQVEISLDILTILSKRDNIIMFCMAKEGLKTHSSELHDEIPTKNRYYKALKQLKDAGLIEKLVESRDTYVHTTFGCLIYQKVIVGITEYKNNIEKIKMIDTLKQSTKNSKNDILKFIESVMRGDINYNNDISDFHSDIIWSYDKLILSIIEKVKNCKKELLIATRLYSEEVINEIILKSKIGVKAKILSDTKLVQAYFESQNQNYEFTYSNEVNDDNKKNERLKVLENPWYPNEEGIQRKILDIPFGLIVIDEEEVGLELVNHNDTQNFYAGIFIKDKKLISTVKDFYMKMWDGASIEIPINDLHLVK